MRLSTQNAMKVLAFVFWKFSIELARDNNTIKNKSVPISIMESLLFLFISVDIWNEGCIKIKERFTNPKSNHTGGLNDNMTQLIYVSSSELSPSSLLSPSSFISKYVSIIRTAML